MNKSKEWTAILTAVLFCLSGERVRADGVHVGRSAAGQLRAEVEPAFVNLNLTFPTTPGGLFNGWTVSDPGYIDLLDPDVPPDFLPLEPGASVWLAAVAIDPALKVIGTDFRIVQASGDDTFLGDSTFIFDTHPTYLIDSDDPLFDPAQSVWRGTFILRDDGATGYALSEPFTLSFTNVPLPPGDMNCDGLVDGNDIGLFVEALLDPLGFSGCNINNADTNLDGLVNEGDIASFIVAVLGT